MTYTKNTWQTGDVVTADKLNNMENGIAGACLIVNADQMTGTLDKTAKQIRDAAQSGVVIAIVDGEDGLTCLYFSLTATMHDGGDHDSEIMVGFYNFINNTLYSFYAATENDYPVLESEGSPS